MKIQINFVSSFGARNSTNSPRYARGLDLISAENAFSEALRPARLERATYGSGGRRSIQLNYGRE